MSTKSDVRAQDLAALVEDVQPPRTSSSNVGAFDLVNDVHEEILVELRNRFQEQNYVCVSALYYHRPRVQLYLWNRNLHLFPSLSRTLNNVML